MTASRSEFAQALQAARTARGLSVLQVAAELRLSDKQIQGLEQDDLANFYSAAYAERAATAYANFLNVATDLLGGPPYAAATEAPPLVPPVSSPATTAQRRATASVSLYAAMGVLLAGAILFLLVGRAGDEPPSPHDSVAVTPPVKKPETPPAATVAAPVAASTPVPIEPATQDVLPPAEAPEPPAQNEESVSRGSVPELAPSEATRSRRFWLVVTAPALINVVDGRGERVLSGRQTITEGRRVTGEPPFQLETDNPDSIAVFYMGDRVRPLQSSTNRYSARFGSAD